MKNKCENLSLYIIDELSKSEKELFEYHLKKCTYCQHELESLQETWQTLSNDIEIVDVPESLKSEVMDFIFESSETLKQEKVQVEKKRFMKPFKLLFTKHFSPLAVAVTTVLVFSIIGLYWNNYQIKDAMTTIDNESVHPTQIVSTFTLKGQNGAASANGTAYLLQAGNDSSLVIELNNLPTTKDDEVYQVWLLKNGTRQSAGTLKPDQNGNGLITYHLLPDYSFDNIGITLEPNPNNTQPQGQKVMGTS